MLRHFVYSFPPYIRGVTCCETQRRAFDINYSSNENQKLIYLVIKLKTVLLFIISYIKPYYSRYGVKLKNAKI